MTTNAADVRLKSTQAKTAKQPYTAPRLTVHGSVAELTTATGLDGLLAS